MHVAVTGASGFVGRAACRALLQAGCTVRGLTRGDAGLLPGVDPVIGDLSDRSALDCLMVGAEAVVHAAGLVRSADSDALARANVDGTRALLERSTGVARLVHISTAGVHGAPGGLVHERSPFAPRNPYEASKAAAEALLRLSRSSGLNIIRPTNVLGVGHPADPLARFLRAVRAGRLVTTTTARTNYVSVRVVADTIAAVVLGNDAPEVLLVNEGMSVAALATVAADVLGVPDRTHVLPRALTGAVSAPLMALAGAWPPLERIRGLVDTTTIESREAVWVKAMVEPALPSTLREMVDDYRIRGLV